ncbi:glycoside hydrolase family 2 protein [Bipolaris maydis]|nr:glycoside hydrolase family 2 protein [Bipolaris maydis]
MAMRLLTAFSWVAQGALASTTTLQQWNVISSANVVDDPIRLSQSGINTSSWYSIGPAATLMNTLISNAVYNDTDLFYSTNMQKIDTAQFRIPWYYRTDKVVIAEKTPNDYYTLITNGITSRADIWVNGQLIVNKETQAGSYAGIEYDISNLLQPNGAQNVVLVKAYPTDYNRDFAISFLDWNPAPQDNGTGIWRPFQLKRTGQVRLTTPRVTSHAALDGGLDIFVDVKNMAKEGDIEGSVACTIFDPNKLAILSATSRFRLSGSQQSTISFRGKVDNPQLWWPYQWGSQPLYSIQCSASTPNNSVSDSTPPTNFGIRTVTSSLNPRFNDTTFFVNGHRFQAQGAGYTSDIFLRFDLEQTRRQFQLVKDMGLNTVRSEGKQEHPEFYDLADQMGIMILAGWECCNKWEGWTYNDIGSGEKWTDPDYPIAARSMKHEAAMMRHHPSILGFLIGSDFWPNDRATQIYLDALSAVNWDIPILASAIQWGAPAQLNNSGLKMQGPYDWEPPNYWYDPQRRYGSAAGFGSELSAGAGTPELNSLVRFLSPSDLEDLWREPKKGLYHMATEGSVFHTRDLYNTGLWARYGAPSSLSDYVLKAQMMDYEATRAQFESLISTWNEALERPATGMIYWMLNNAWPSLHWNLFDYYLRPAGAYFGTKDALGTRETLTLNYETQAVSLVNRLLVPNTPGYVSDQRIISMQIVSLNGTTIASQTTAAITKPNSAHEVARLPTWQNKTTDPVVLVRLQLNNGNSTLLKKTYWLSHTPDTLDWGRSDWYYTPVAKYEDYSALSSIPAADLSISATYYSTSGTNLVARLVLRNTGTVPAVFVRLNVVDAVGRDVGSLMWSKNYFTLLPGEEEVVEVRGGEGVGARVLVVDGRNVGERKVVLGY